MLDFPFLVEYFDTGDWKVMGTGNLRLAVDFLKYCYAGMCFHGHDPTLFIHRHRMDGHKAFHCSGNGIERIDRRQRMRSDTPKAKVAGVKN